MTDEQWMPENKGELLSAIERVESVNQTFQLADRRANVRAG